MDREEIIRMAREAGCKPFRSPEHWDDVQVFATPDVLERFAALVAEHERAACAALCDEREEIFQKYYAKGLPALCASAIRART